MPRSRSLFLEKRIKVTDQASEMGVTGVRFRSVKCKRISMVSDHLRLPLKNNSVEITNSQTDVFPDGLEFRFIEPTDELFTKHRPKVIRQRSTEPNQARNTSTFLNP